MPPPANSPRLGSITANFASGTGDPDVAAAEHLHAAGGAEAVHRGDHRLVERPVAEHRAGAVVEPEAVDLGEALLRDLLLELRDLGHVRLEVGAREEGLPDSRDDRDPRLVVGREPLPRLAQRLEVRHVGRVAGLGPVDRDEHDVFGILGVVDRHGRDVTAQPDVCVSDARG